MVNMIITLATSQSLKDQGKSRTGWSFDVFADDRSQSLKDQGKSRTITMDDIEDYFGESQSLKDQGKSRTIA